MDNASPVSAPSPTAIPSADAAHPVYTLEQLLAVASEHLGEEVSSRTVRLYATQGLIDRPGKEGRTAVYGRRHLLQLLLIRTLARRGLSLAAIAPLTGQDDEALEQQFRDLAAGESAPPDISPSVEPLQASASGEQPTNGTTEALDYLQGLSDSHPSTASTPSKLLPLLGTPLSHRTDTSPSYSSPSRSRYGNTRDAATRWHRFTLAPGVELHISDAVSVPPAGSRRRAWLNRLIARLLELLEDPQP